MASHHVALKRALRVLRDAHIRQPPEPGVDAVHWILTLEEAGKELARGVDPPAGALVEAYRRTRPRHRLDLLQGEAVAIQRDQRRPSLLRRRTACLAERVEFVP